MTITGTPEEIVALMGLLQKFPKDSQELDDALSPEQSSAAGAIISEDMPAQWTGDVVYELHMAGITGKELAEKLGYTRQYVSEILNGHKSPNGAEARFRAALEELVAEKYISPGEA